MNILFTEWFSTSTMSFGIVVGEDTVTKQKKAYIGACQPSGNPASDSKHIAEYGAKIFPATLRNLLKKLEE